MEHKIVWTVQIERAGNYVLYACAYFFGNELILRIEDESGKVVREQHVTADEEKVHAWEFSFDREGKYRLVLMPKKGKGSSARTSKQIFVVPKEVAQKELGDE
ncbi:MAG: Gmad2 immunoglobulin-like domain-containing protein [Armatimonadetes bacterium]|nr:Gmad2 immunoglobulin-like domain-containing protein [Armatimonadota bacterium]